MPQVYIPAGSRIFMQSAAAASQAIEDITAANPGVVNYVGTDPTDNSYVAFTDMVGMTQLEDALVKVTNVNTTEDTFEMKDQDTIGYDAFVSGNMTPVTLDTEIRVASGMTMSGGEQEFADFQYLWDKLKRKKPSTQTPVDVGIPCIWDPQDPSMIAVRKAADLSTQQAFKILFPGGLEILFYGYIGASGLPNVGDLGSVVTTNITIAVATRPRYIFPA